MSPITAFYEPEDEYEPPDEPPGPGPCALCGRNPALGYASVAEWDGREWVESWYCHGDDDDDDDEPTCYEVAPV